MCGKLTSEIKPKAISSGQVRGEVSDNSGSTQKPTLAGSSALDGLTVRATPSWGPVRRSHGWGGLVGQGGAMREGGDAMILEFGPCDLCHHHHDAPGLLISYQSVWAETNPRAKMEPSKSC